MTSEAFKILSFKCLHEHMHGIAHAYQNIPHLQSPVPLLSLVTLVSITECSCCLCILPPAQLLQPDSPLVTTLCLKPIGCRSGNRMQEIKRLTDSTCSSGFLQKGGLYFPTVYHLLLRISEFLTTQSEEEADVSDLQPCRLLCLEMGSKG